MTLLKRQVNLAVNISSVVMANIWNSFFQETNHVRAKKNLTPVKLTVLFFHCHTLFNFAKKLGMIITCLKLELFGKIICNYNYYYLFRKRFEFNYRYTKPYIRYVNAYSLFPFSYLSKIYNYMNIHRDLEFRFFKVEYYYHFLTPYFCKIKKMVFTISI